MPAIVVKAFNGLKPISDPVLLEETDAQIANNVLLNSGAMRPMRGLTTLQPLKKFGAKTIFRFDPNNDQDENHYWLEFAEPTSVMRSPIAQDQWDRVYWADGIGPAKYATLSMAVTPSGSDLSLPGASYLLGVPKPTTKPVVSAFGEVVKIVTVTRTYCMTNCTHTPAFKESAPSKTWNVQAVDGSPVKLTGIPTDRQGDTSVDSKNIYRKASDGKFRGVVQIPIDQAEYEDTVDDATLLTRPEMTVTVSNLPPAPIYAPSASPEPLPTGSASTGIERRYAYMLVNFNWAGVDYKYSALSPEAKIVADDSQAVVVSGMVDPTNSASYFKLFRADANNGNTMLYIFDVTINSPIATDGIEFTKLGTGPESDGAPKASAPPAPTLVLSGAAANAPIRRVYMVTYIDVSNNEGPRSPVSTVVEVVDGVTGVSLSHTEPAPLGVAKKRLYRQDVTTSSGVIAIDDAKWVMVAENTASAGAAYDKIPTADLPGISYPVGLQKVPPTPKTTPAAAATIPPSVVPESRVYCYTLVTAYDEEGPPSDPSDVVSCDPAKDVTVTVPLPPGGNYNFAKKYLYRSATGTAQTKFQFVGEMPVGVTTYVDKIKTSALSELLPSEGWIPPPDKLDGLRLMANGAAVGFAGNSLYFSEPNLPHAWPHEYPLDDEIVGIGVFGQSVAVLTNGYPYLFQGIDPAAMASTRMTLPQACANKMSIVETGDGVLYASPDGLTMIGMATSMLTQPILSRQQWQDYNPASMQSYVYNGRVIITYVDQRTFKPGTLVIDLSGASALFTTSDINAGLQFSSGYYSPQTDTLYFAQGDTIVRFDAGQPLIATWHSKVFRLPEHDNFGWAQVICRSYDTLPSPPRLQVFADGVLRYTKTITGPDQFRLPSGFKAMDWEFEIDGVVVFTEVFIASSSAELQSA
jgi:hypothetical protein